MTCKCSKFRKQLVVYKDPGELPDALRRIIDECPECRVFWESTQGVRGVVSLKRFEQPAPKVLADCRAEVVRQVEELHDDAGPATVWGAGFGVSALRFGMMALLVSLLGLHVLSTSHLPTISTSSHSLAEYVRVQEQQEEEARVAREASYNADYRALQSTNWHQRVQQSSAYQFIGLSR